jgi:hypothetical protein
VLLAALDGDDALVLEPLAVVARSARRASRRWLHVARVVPDDVALDENLAPDAYDSSAGPNLPAQLVQPIPWHEREEPNGRTSPPHAMIVSREGQPVSAVA